MSSLDARHLANLQARTLSVKESCPSREAKRGLSFSALKCSCCQMLHRAEGTTLEPSADIC
jgi:hypothetical protein